MKVVSIKPFVDKYTNEFFNSGSVLEVTEDRAAELAAAGVIAAEEKPQAEKPKTKRKKTK